MRNFSFEFSNPEAGNIYPWNGTGHRGSCVVCGGVVDATAPPTVYIRLGVPGSRTSAVSAGMLQMARLYISDILSPVSWPLCHACHAQAAGLELHFKVISA